MSAKLNTKPKPKSTFPPKSVAPRPKSASAISSNRVAPAPATEENDIKTADEPSAVTPIKKKKRKRVKAQGRTQGGKKGVFAAANKIKTLTQDLIKLRQERKKLYPTYEPSTSRQPVKRQQSPPHPRMEVDMDVVHVSSAHSPYLVRPELGYTDKILKTNVELRQTVGANAGKKLRDVDGLPYDIETSKKVYNKEVVNFRAKYRSCLPSERVQSAKPAASDPGGPICIPQYHNKAPKLSAKPTTVKNIVLFDPKRPYSAPPVTTRASTTANPNHTLSPSKNTLYGTCNTQTSGNDVANGDHEREELVEGGYSQDFCEEDNEGEHQHDTQGESPKHEREALTLTLEDYEQYLQELNEDLFTPNNTKRQRAPRTPPATTQASFFQRSLMSMGASFSASKITPSRPSSSPSMRQAQKQHTDLKYRQNQSPKTSRFGSNPLVLAGTRGLDGERQWPGMSAQFRASQVRGGPNQFRTDKTLMKAFQAFVATFSPGRGNDTATFNDEFGVFGSDEEKEVGEEAKEEEGGDWKDFLLSDAVPTKQQTQQPVGTSPVVKDRDESKNDSAERHSDRVVKWRMGDKVEAWFARKAKYYPGIVRRVHRKSEEFDIDYDDGDRETCVPLDYLRKRPPAPSSSKKSNKASLPPKETPPGVGTEGEKNDGFVIGDKVLANYMDEGEWFPGRISRVVVLPGDIAPTLSPSGECPQGARLNSSLWYDVEYDDGDKEYGLPSCRIKGPEETAAGKEGVELDEEKHSSKQSPQPKTPPSLKKKKSSVKFKLRPDSANGKVPGLYETKTEDDDLPTNAIRYSPQRDRSRAIEMDTSQRIQDIRNQLNKSFPNSTMTTDIGGTEKQHDNYLVEKGRNVHLDLVTDATLTPEQRFAQQKHLMDELMAEAIREKELRTKEEEAARRSHGEMQTSELANVMGIMDHLAVEDKQEQVRREQLKQKCHEMEGEDCLQNYHTTESVEERRNELQDDKKQESTHVSDTDEHQTDHIKEDSNQPNGQETVASEPANTGLQSPLSDSRIGYQHDFEEGSAASRGMKTTAPHVSSGGSALSYGDDFDRGSSRVVMHEKAGVVGTVDKQISLLTPKNGGSGSDLENISVNRENFNPVNPQNRGNKTVDNSGHDKAAVRQNPIVNEVQSEASLATSYGQDFEDASELHDDSVASKKKVTTTSLLKNHPVVKNKSVDEVSYTDDFDHQSSEGVLEGKRVGNQPPRDVSVVVSDEDDYGDDFDDGSDKMMSGSQPAQKHSVASGGGQVASVLSSGMSGDDYGDDFDEGSEDNDDDEYANEGFD